MQPDNYTDLPVLTEVVDAEGLPATPDHLRGQPSQAEAGGSASADPIANERDAEEIPALALLVSDRLSEGEYQRLAMQIAPQLEALLQQKFSAQFETLWQEVWRQAEATLPDLMRATFSGQTPASDSQEPILRNSPAAAAAERTQPVYPDTQSMSIGPASPAVPNSSKNMELAKSFEPQAIEAHWYPIWENAGNFRARIDSEKPAYCIMLPPPNVTGTLHMGHAFQDTLMDALIRYHRMKGDNTLWQPGTDHAGIATQIVVERQLEAKNISRHDLGREEFVERVWDWKEESGSTITRQMRRLGASCDWSRERFTMDEGLSEAVTEVFVKLHEQGLIYRGKRLVNWDPVLGTAVSDLEVVAQEEDGFIWHIGSKWV